MKHSMYFWTKTGLLVVFLFAVTSCSGPNLAPDFQRHDLKVRRVHDTHTVIYNDGSAKLTRTQQEHLLSTVSHYGQRTSQWINILVRRGPLTSSRVDQLYGLLIGSGTPPKNISVTYLKDHGPDHHIELRISKYGVILPPCPDWSSPSGRRYQNDDSSNFGCAQSYNLGLMLEDPRDLIEDQPMSGADGMKEEQAIKRYRTDKVKELPSGLLFNNTGGGN